MGRYVLKRLLWMIFILVGAAFVIFTILYITPGNPAEVMLGSDASKEEILALDAKLGIDKPYLEQLGVFLFNTFIKWIHCHSIKMFKHF